MEIRAVDERDSQWEDDRPRFRVYIFTGGVPDYSWTTATYDVTEADVIEVIAWAADRAGHDGLYAVALVRDDRSRAVGDRRGLVWLLGTDANDSREDPITRDRFEAMVARRGQRIVHGPQDR